MCEFPGCEVSVLCVSAVKVWRSAYVFKRAVLAWVCSEPLVRVDPLTPAQTPITDPLSTAWKVI